MCYLSVRKQIVMKQNRKPTEVWIYHSAWWLCMQPISTLEPSLQTLCPVRTHAVFHHFRTSSPPQKDFYRWKSFFQLRQEHFHRWKSSCRNCVIIGKVVEILMCWNAWWGHKCNSLRNPNHWFQHRRISTICVLIGQVVEILMSGFCVQPERL